MVKLIVDNDYLCKNWGHRYTVKKRSTENLDETKRIALKLYLKGIGFRAIGRVLGVNSLFTIGSRNGSLSKFTQK